MKRILIISTLLLSVLTLNGCHNDNNENKIQTNAQSTATNNTEIIEDKETAPKVTSIKVGDTIKIEDKLEIKIKKMEFAYDVLPDDTSGFYTHYEAEEGKVFVHIDTDVKNLQKSDIRVSEIASLEADYNNGYKYRGNPVPEDSTTGFTYPNITAISPLETLGVRWLVDVPLEVKESEAPLNLTFNINDEVFELTYR